MNNQNVKFNEIAPNTIEISLSGDISLNRAEKIKESIDDVFPKYQHIEVSIDDVENFDLFSIQLLYSMKKTAAGQKKSIKYNINLPNEIIQLVNHAGFDNFSDIHK